MDAYYSQHGEDFLLSKIFKGKDTGYFVEIGCLDGIEYSNTYYFEKKGWNGACIEAHNDFINTLTTNRPKSRIIHCAVGEEDKDEVTFYANKVGSLSTLDKNEEERWRTKYSRDFYGFEEQKVSMRTMTSIFDELKLKEIDFVSLDIEGYEVNALAGLDFTKYKPTVFIIEYKDEPHKEQLERILFAAGYSFIHKLGCNLFYSLDARHKAIIDADHGTISLIRIGDKGTQVVEKVKLVRPSMMDKLRTFIRGTFFGKMWTGHKKRRYSIN